MHSVESLPLQNTCSATKSEDWKEINNNDDDDEDKTHDDKSTRKKSLVKMTNREGSTRSLSCFKNPELSSKDLALSEEMTVDMYLTDIDINDDGSVKENTKQSANELNRRLNSKGNSYREGNGYFTNGMMEVNDYRSSRGVRSESLEYSTDLEVIGSNGQEVVDENRSGFTSVEEVNVNRRGSRDEEVKINNRGQGFKRAAAFDQEFQSHFVGVSDDQLPDTMKHRHRVVNVARERNGSDDFKGNKSHKYPEIASLRYDDDREIQAGKMSRPSNSANRYKAAMAPDDASDGPADLDKTVQFKSVRKMKEQFDSQLEAEWSKTSRSQSLTSTLTNSKPALQMKKSPPSREEWTENVKVPLWRSMEDNESESSVAVSKNMLDGPFQIKLSQDDPSANNKQNRSIKVEYQDGNDPNGSQYSSSRDNYPIRKESVVKVKASSKFDPFGGTNGYYETIDQGKYEADPYVIGRVGEKREYFDSLKKNSQPMHNNGSIESEKKNMLDYEMKFEKKELPVHKNLRGRTEPNRKKIDRRDPVNWLEELRWQSNHGGVPGGVNGHSSGLHRYPSEDTDHEYLEPMNVAPVYRQNTYENGLTNADVRKGSLSNGRKNPTIYNNIPLQHWSSKRQGDREVIDHSLIIPSQSIRNEGGVSPVSDAASEDRESSGEYELPATSGGYEVSRTAMSSETKNAESSKGISNHVPTSNENTPGGIAQLNLRDNQNFSDYNSNVSSQKEKPKIEVNGISTTGKPKTLKKPKGAGPNFGQIWFEEQNKRPSPMPMRSTKVMEEEDEEEEEEEGGGGGGGGGRDFMYKSNDETSDNVNYDDDGRESGDDAGYKMPKAVTQQVTKTVPSGVVSVIQSETKDFGKTTPKISGAIIACPPNKPKPLDIKLISGSIEVEKDKSISLPARTIVRREPSIEVVAKHNPVSQTQSYSTYQQPSFTPSLPMMMQRQEDALDKYNGRQTSMSILETELLSIAPELKDAQKTGRGYKITMNLTPTLLMTSRPGSALPPQNSSLQFKSPTFSPPVIPSGANQLSRQNSNYSHPYDQTATMRSAMTATPSVFMNSPPVQSLQTTRNFFQSGSVVVSVNESPKANSSCFPVSQEPGTSVTFNLSLDGTKNKPAEPSPADVVSNNFIQTSVDKKPMISLQKPQKKKQPAANQAVHTPVSSKRSAPREIGFDEEEPKHVVHSSRGASRSLTQNLRPLEVEGDQAFEFAPTESKRIVNIEKPSNNNNLIGSAKRNFASREVAVEKPSNNKADCRQQNQYYSTDVNDGYGRQQSTVSKLDLQALLRGAASDSVKQKIDVKRLGDKLLHGPAISEELKDRIAKDDMPPSENDKVSEEISMNIDNGKVTMTSQIVCEKTVPVYNSQDLYKTSSMLLTRVIEVDLSVTPERRQLYQLLVGPNIEGRPLSDAEKKELYVKFKALAEHSRFGMM